MSYSRFQDILREAVAPVILAEQAQWVVTYSLRRVGASLTQMFNLDGKKEHAFGGWSITSASKDACDVRRSMPLFYNGRRGAMEEATQLAVWRVLATPAREARSMNLHPTWEDIAALASAHSDHSIRCARLLLKEEHIAAVQAEASYSRLAFGVTLESVVDKRFSITAIAAKKQGRSEEQVVPACA